MILLRSVKRPTLPVTVSQKVERVSHVIPKERSRALAAALMLLGVVALGLGLRRWGVKLAGTFLRVPYDLRLPTPARIRERLWNPADQRVFTPHIFGWGWSVNLPAVKNRLKRLRRNNSRGRESLVQRLFRS